VRDCDFSMKKSEIHFLSPLECIVFRFGPW
jgi:hypothetical protein